MTFWDGLRGTTQARIGLGRAGDALPTRAVLDFAAAHAAARDAVHEELDVDALIADVSTLMPDPLVVTSRARDRAEYLRRPDRGRRLRVDVPAGSPAAGDGLVVVIADGLSARAVHAHAVPLLRELTGRVGIARVVVATQARVALGDAIGVALGARAVLVLIGERPGLSVTDSLGAYLTWAPRPGRTDAERNCVSNVHPPDGLGYADAARSIAGLLASATELGASGVMIKDRSRPALTGDQHPSRPPLAGRDGC